MYKVLKPRVSQIQKRFITNNISHLYKITLADTINNTHTLANAINNTHTLADAINNTQL